MKASFIQRHSLCRIVVMREARSWHALDCNCYHLWKGGTDVKKKRLVSSAELGVLFVPYADEMVARVVNIDGEPYRSEKPDETLECVKTAGVTPPSINSIPLF